MSVPGKYAQDTDTNFDIFHIASHNSLTHFFLKLFLEIRICLMFLASGASVPSGACRGAG